MLDRASEQTDQTGVNSKFKLTPGGADNNLDYLEVVHVLIRRPHSSSQALYQAREAHSPDHSAV